MAGTLTAVWIEKSRFLFETWRLLETKHLFGLWHLLEVLRKISSYMWLKKLRFLPRDALCA